MNILPYLLLGVSRMPRKAWASEGSEGKGAGPGLLDVHLISMGIHSTPLESAGSGSGSRSQAGFRSTFHRNSSTRACYSDSVPSTLMQRDGSRGLEGRISDALPSRFFCLSEVVQAKVRGNGEAKREERKRKRAMLVGKGRAKSDE